MQNDGLLSSVETVNSIKELDETSEKLNKTPENFKNPLNVEKDKSQLHHNNEDNDKYKTDDKTTDNLKESSCDAIVIYLSRHLKDF